MAEARLRSSGCKKKRLKVLADPKSNIIQISVFNGSPVVAQEIAARLMEKFAARQSVIFGAPQTVFLQKQADSMQKKMESSQQELLDFKQKQGITLLDEEIAQLLAEKEGTCRCIPSRLRATCKPRSPSSRVTMPLWNSTLSSRQPHYPEPRES